MGADIHAVVQRKKDGKWITYAEGYSRRNYDVFAVMANVRNGHGFAGCLLSDGLKVVHEPKGLPKDLRFVGKRKQDVKCPNSFRKFPGSFRSSEDKIYWLGDHDHSWLTLTELLTINSEDVTKHYGVMTDLEFEKLGSYFLQNRRQPRQVEYCGDVFGKDITTLKEEDYLACKQSGTLPRDKQIYVQTWWNETYGESLGLAFWIWLLQLIRDALCFGCDLDSIRVVFGFDS